MKYCKVRLFADDTNLLIKNANLKQLQKHLNIELKQLCNWLKANKISLNSDKTKLLMINPAHTKQVVPLPTVCRQHAPFRTNV